MVATYYINDSPFHRHHLLQKQVLRDDIGISRPLFGISVPADHFCGSRICSLAEPWPVSLRLHPFLPKLFVEAGAAYVLMRRLSANHWWVRLICRLLQQTSASALKYHEIGMFLSL